MCGYFLLRVFADGLCRGDVCWSESSTEVFRSGLRRDAFLCFEPAVDFHSHSVETTGTLVDGAETVATAVVGQGRWRAGQTFVVANCILELLDLQDFSLQFLLEMLHLKLLDMKLLVSTRQLCFQMDNSQPSNQNWISKYPERQFNTQRRHIRRYSSVEHTCHTHCCNKHTQVKP